MICYMGAPTPSAYMCSPYVYGLYICIWTIHMDYIYVYGLHICICIQSIQSTDSHRAVGSRASHACHLFHLRPVYMYTACDIKPFNLGFPHTPLLGSTPLDGEVMVLNSKKHRRLQNHAQQQPFINPLLVCTLYFQLQSHSNTSRLLLIVADMPSCSRVNFSQYLKVVVAENIKGSLSIPCWPAEEV